MSVLLGLISREVGRYAECYASIIGLDKPPGSGFINYRGYSTPQGWNMIVDSFLKSEHEYLFTMNDDHIYPPDTITRLMARNMDCVTGLYLLKQYPFEPVIYDMILPNGMGHRYLNDGDNGLIEILTCGDGCLLTHRRVFEAIPRPWYKLTAPPAPPDQIACDIIFCNMLRAYGFKIHCDLDVQIGHIAAMPIFPKVMNGKWVTAFAQGDGDAIAMPAATPTARAEAKAESERQKTALLEQAPATNEC